MKDYAFIAYFPYKLLKAALLLQSLPIFLTKSCLSLGT